MEKWKEDKAWADRFLPEIKLALGPHILTESAADEDRFRNTDLTVVKAAPVRIACRVRRPNRFMRHPYEFTLRSGRPNGTPTELQKIIAGWGDLLVYGVSDPAEQRLQRWMLCDLRVFRLWMARHLQTRGGQVPGVEKTNGDGSSRFRVFDARELPEEFVVARYGALDMAA